MLDPAPSLLEITRRRTVALARALRLRCPRCGKGSMSAGLLKPRPFCTQCCLNFSLKEGEFTGGVYINYAVTGLLFVLGFVLTEVYGHMDTTPEVALWVGFGLLFPFLFQRHAVAMFTAILYLTGALENGPEES